MLNRRNLRIKVMQALYGYFQTEQGDLMKGEKELVKSINKIYDLYIYILLLLIDVVEHGRDRLEEGKKKKLPKPEDLNPNMRFVENRLVKKLDDNHQLTKEVNARKLTWHEEPELIRRIYNDIKEDPEYNKYMLKEEVSFKDDKKIMEHLFKEQIAGREHLHFIYEEQNIFWASDLAVVNTAVLKTIQGMKEKDTRDKRLLTLFKDEDEDRKFAMELFRKTILFSDEYEKLIDTKLKNWELERIAMLDIILMKMGVTELLHFKTIPTKVTLNEYIEIAKDFSTPKSKNFINGILDQLLGDFKKEKKLNKVGRGLLET